MGRRKFLILGGTGAAVLAGTAGAARALIVAGGPNPSPRSQDPVGLNPSTGRASDAIGAPPGGVYQLALAGTDGWVSFPYGDPTHPAGVAADRGIGPVDPYFPDPLADPANTTTYAFCFRNVTGLDRSQVAAQKGRTQICAPIIYSTVGQELWITLTNLGLALRPDLTDGHTLHWHGFRNAIPFYDGVPESSIAVAIDHDFTYVYRPLDSGTYMYHCHFEDVEHVTMGMHGIVFVKPDPATVSGPQAYGPADGDTTGDTSYDREYAIMLNEIDTRAHFGDAHIQETNWTDFHADIWTLNGRAYPDTLEPNGVRDDVGNLVAQTWDGTYSGGAPNLTAVADHRLANNPLSSLVQCSPGERVLIRFANLGMLNHTMVFPGLSVDVLGRDARYVQSSAQRIATDSIQIGPGESRDVFFTAPAAGTYAFYDRGMSHYGGSADGTDAWVGGQRSHIEVVNGLAPQLKPNGWAGEGEWDGEFPRKLVHAGPVVTVTGARSATGSNNARSPKILGTVTPSDGTSINGLWRFTGNVPPAGGNAAWTPISDSSPESFGPIVVGNATQAVRTYWVIARDSLGTYGAPASVTI
jgi:FtsP/CotA-like multicopper oxidase with cupredoxin domain